VAITPLFSTYRQGENRVTASLLAVLQRLGIHLTERILSGLLEEPELSLVTFTALPTTTGIGNPDAEVKGHFHYLFEVKTSRGLLGSPKAAALKLAYAEKLSTDPGARLIILTPDARVPSPLQNLEDPRIVWTNFVKLAEVLRDLLNDEDEPAGERERYLVRELIALFQLEGLLDDLDTVVVAARNAYPAYLTYGSYICQPNRAIRPVSRMAFYTGKEVKQHVPLILARRQNVDLTVEQISELDASGDPKDHAVAEIIQRNLRDNYPHTPGKHDVYLLTPKDDPRTSTLATPLPFYGSGAFTMGQRYVAFAKLASATSCDELVETK